MLPTIIVVLAGIFLFKLVGIGLRNSGAVAIISGAGLVMMYFSNMQFEKDIAQIQIEVVGTVSTCAQPNHLQVKITNGDEREVSGFAFALHAYRPNHSSSVAYVSHDSDRIIVGGRSWVSCWVVEDLAKMPLAQQQVLRWEAELTRVDLD